LHSSNYYYLLAVNLSLLSFYLGVLIYAIPIPLKGFKRWGPTLIKDGLLSFTLLITLPYVLKFINDVASSLGGSWSYFNLWFSGSLTFALSGKAIVLTLSSIFSKVPLLSSARSIITPINEALNLDIIFLGGIWAIYYMVKVLGHSLLIFGILLYSVPFRISRDAGAWFISFILVFTIGLQLMPVFLSASTSYTYSASTSPMSLGLRYASVKVENAYSKPVPGSLVLFFIKRGNAFVEVSAYRANGNGFLYSPGYNYSDLVSLPSNVPLYAYLEEDGVAFKLYPYPIEPSSFNSTSLKLVAENLFYSSKGYTIVFSNSKVNVSESNDNVSITAYSSGYVDVRFVDGCAQSFSYKNATLRETHWHWDNLQGSSYNFTLSKGSRISFISEGSCSVRGFKARYVDYAMNFIKLPSLISPSLLKDIILYYLTFPFLYFSLLISITYGLSRLIGGRRGIVPRVL